MSHKLSLVASATLLCTCLPYAHADEGLSWKLSGFGTVGAAHSSEREADFVASLVQPSGAGHTSAWSAGVDSKLGGQVDLRLNPQWFGSVQLLTRHQYDDSYTPELSVGFAKWAPGNGMELRAGRLPYAAFVVSDYRNIGYSQTWVRPPVEVYGLGFDHVDGADATWRSAVGGVGIKVQGMAGRSTQNIDGGKLTAKGLMGANVTADLDAITARLSYVAAKFSLHGPALDGLFSMVRSGLPAGALGPGAPALPADPASADEFETTDKRISYLSLGLSYDPGAWFVTGEFGRLGRAGVLRSVNEFYLTLGLRSGAFTPFASFAQLKSTGALSISNPLVQAGIDSLKRDQKTVSLGLRWDFAKSADLKVQFDRVSNDVGARGFLTNMQPGFATGGRYSVVSTTVDFVF